MPPSREVCSVTILKKWMRSSMGPSVEHAGVKRTSRSQYHSSQPTCLFFVFLGGPPTRRLGQIPQIAVTIETEINGETEIATGTETETTMISDEAHKAKRHETRATVRIRAAVIEKDPRAEPEESITGRRLKEALSRSRER